MKKIALSKLATKRDRLQASFFDSIILTPLWAIQLSLRKAPIGPGGTSVSFLEYFKIPNSIVIIFLIYSLIIIVVQTIKLTRYGQTIGKQYLKIKIVRIVDGKNGGFITNCILRFFIIEVICLIPIFGPLFCLADPLFIFRKNWRRCIHDDIARTCVVKA